MPASHGAGHGCEMRVSMTDEINVNSFFGAVGDDKAFRDRYGDQIGAGMAAVIYARDGIAAKVFRENQSPHQAFLEGYTMAVVNSLNIPAPKVYGVETFCNRTVLLMDQVKGISLLDVMLQDRNRIPECMDTVVKLQAALHKVEFSGFLPLKSMQKRMIDASPGLTSEEKEKLLKMLDSLPDGTILCHGDFHGGNILCEGKSCMIIDWAEVSCGDPAADACRSYMDYCIAGQGFEELYIEKYCAVTGRRREDILAWLPVVAGAVYGYLSPEAQKAVRPLF